MLQELEQLEGAEAKEEAGQLPSVPKVPAHEHANYLPPMLSAHSPLTHMTSWKHRPLQPVEVARRPDKL